MLLFIAHHRLIGGLIPYLARFDGTIILALLRRSMYIDRKKATSAVLPKHPSIVRACGSIRGYEPACCARRVTYQVAPHGTLRSQARATIELPLVLFFLTFSECRSSFFFFSETFLNERDSLTQISSEIRSIFRSSFFS